VASARQPLSFVPAGVVAGLLLVGALAAAARGVTAFLPEVISEITIGVVAGIVVASVVGVPEVFRPGIRFAVHRLLRLGIVLLGARLSVDAIVGTGATALVVILACVAFAFGAVLLLSRVSGIPPRLATLIAVGTAICGNSAIVATAPIIKAEDREVSFAVATITLFGVAAVIVYPWIGSLLGLSDSVFGVWAGVAVNDTSQVTASGFAYSTGAGDIATIVKLTRNLLIGPVLVVVGLLAARGAGGEEAPRGFTLRSLAQVVPLFVLGFIAMAALNSIGLIPGEAKAPLGEAARILILLALCGVGLGTDVRALLRVGPKPLYVGLLSALGLALLGLLGASLLFG
jgi:uncharacterized integral membrane protein (TIGR00698 family)